MRTPRPVRLSSFPRPLAAVLLVASLALAGCGAAGDAGGSGAKSAADGAAPRAGAGAGRDHGTVKLAPSALVRTASLAVEVVDVPSALARARATAEDAGGYVGEETTGRDAAGHERTRVVLRVPTAAYDRVLTGLQGAGRLTDLTAKAEDVTDQVVDVDSRITSQRASVARVRALMGRADKLTDVVALEGELSRREADLESLLARQASLRDRTGLATITLSLSGRGGHGSGGDDGPGFLDALSGGWHAFLAMLRWIALVLGAVLPFAALAALLTAAWLRLVRPRRARRRAAAPTTAPGAAGPLPAARPVTGDEGAHAEK